MKTSNRTLPARGQTNSARASSQHGAGEECYMPDVIVETKSHQSSILPNASSLSMSSITANYHKTATHSNRGSNSKNAVGRTSRSHLGKSSGSKKTPRSQHINTTVPSIGDFQILVQSMSERPDEVYEVYERIKQEESTANLSFAADDVTEVVCNVDPNRKVVVAAGAAVSSGMDQRQDEEERVGTAERVEVIASTSTNTSATKTSRSAKTNNPPKKTNSMKTSDDDYLHSIMRRLDITPFLDHLQLMSQQKESKARKSKSSAAPYTPAPTPTFNASSISALGSSAFSFASTPIPSPSTDPRAVIRTPVKANAKTTGPTKPATNTNAKAPPAQTTTAVKTAAAPASMAVPPPPPPRPPRSSERTQPPPSLGNFPPMIQEVPVPDPKLLARLKELEKKLEKDASRVEALEEHNHDLFKDLVEERRAASTMKLTNETRIAKSIEETKQHKQSIHKLQEEIAAMRLVQDKVEAELEAQIGKTQMLANLLRDQEEQHEQDMATLKDSHAWDLMRLDAKQVFKDAARAGKSRYIKKDIDALADEIKFRIVLNEKNQAEIKSLKQDVVEFKQELKDEKQRNSQAEKMNASLKETLRSERHTIKLLFDANAHLQSIADDYSIKSCQLEEATKELKTLKASNKEQDKLLQFVTDVLNKRKVPAPCVSEAGSYDDISERDAFSSRSIRTSNSGTLSVQTSNCEDKSRNGNNAIKRATSSHSQPSPAVVAEETVDVDVVIAETQSVAASPEQEEEATVAALHENEDGGDNTDNVAMIVDVVDIDVNEEDEEDDDNGDGNNCKDNTNADVGATADVDVDVSPEVDNGADTGTTTNAAAHSDATADDDNVVVAVDTVGGDHPSVPMDPPATDASSE